MLAKLVYALLLEELFPTVFFLFIVYQLMNQIPNAARWSGQTFCPAVYFCKLAEIFAAGCQRFCTAWVKKCVRLDVERLSGRRRKNRAH